MFTQPFLYRKCIKGKNENLKNNYKDSDNFNFLHIHVALMISGYKLKKKMSWANIFLNNFRK